MKIRSGFVSNSSSSSFIIQVKEGFDENEFRNKVYNEYVKRFDHYFQETYLENNVLKGYWERGHYDIEYSIGDALEEMGYDFWQEAEINQ